MEQGANVKQVQSQPRRVERGDQHSQNWKTELCKHQHGCIKNALLGFKKLFLVGFGANYAVI